MNEPSFLSIYPTPLLLWKSDEFMEANDALADEVLRREAASPRIGAPRRDGWTAQENVFTWPIPAAQQFQQHLQRCASSLTRHSATQKMEPAQMRFSTAINVRRAGNYSPVLDQNYEASWTGVQVLRYETTPSDDATVGRIGILDPRTATSGGYVPGDPFDFSQTVTLETGLTVMFPPWLKYLFYPMAPDSLAVLVFFSVFFRPLSAGPETGERI